ncbi:MAG: hypothetical protein R3325_09095 [Thermoanaerobaculia bacterium]|nr:hypothetical protein [Thermoanaerobaculia bacterium]
MRRLPILLLTLATLAVGAPSDAGALGLYLVGSVGETSADTELGESFRRVIDGDDDSFAIGLGLNLLEWLDVQLEYHDLGDLPGGGAPCPDGPDPCIAQFAPLVADTTALSLSVLPSWELTRRVELFGKLGVLSYESSLSALIGEAEVFVDEFDGEEILYGAGVRVKLLGPLDAFVQYQRFGDAFDEASVGVTLGYD